MTAVLEAPGATVADPTSPTGYCKHRNHKKCPYRPGGACENGIALSDGGFYMCPCDCHAEQRKPAPVEALQRVVAEAVSNGHGIEAKEERPAKSPKAAKAPKPSAEPTKLGNAQKQAVRYAMAAVLRQAFSAEELIKNPGGELDGIPVELVSEYLEAHWLQYIDPDKDKARREAAAAARKAK